VSVDRALIEQAKALRLRRGLSQNFLVSPKVLSAITQATLQDAENLPIVEIGAGAGFLTRYLLDAGANLTAIELDNKMIPVLTEAFGENPRFNLVHKDVRDVDLAPLLGASGVIVGNLPYHLTGPILFMLAGELTDDPWPLRRVLKRAVLMVQKEVGDRLLAKPGDSAYGQLTVQMGFRHTVEPVVFAPSKAFSPPPKVDSIVVSLTPRETPAVDVTDLAMFSRVVKASFLHRRKTLWNNLKIARILPEDLTKEILTSLDITDRLRAQEMSVAQLGALANAFADAR